jgi:hypothetical protein
MTLDNQAPTADIRSLDDVPASAQQAAHQKFLAKWYRLVALGPFALVVLIVLKFFGNSTSKVPDVFVGATLIWAILIAGYTFYLLFFFKCPRCHQRFGSQDSCRSCSLPRHTNSM